MSEEEGQRPIKRIRQACRNCRRKKARCSGDRPICAFCERLNQECSYSDDGDVGTSHRRSECAHHSDTTERQDLSERLTVIESKLSELTQTMNTISSTLLVQTSYMPVFSPRPLTAGTQDQPFFSNVNFSSPGAVANLNTTQESPFTKIPPTETIIGAADVYFRYCHNQPYSLFHEETFRNKLALGEVPRHLLFAFLASAVRYSEDPYYEDKAAALTTYAMQSWKAIVMPWNGIKSDGEISIVQTILLLAIIDYTDGRTQGSWIKVGLAIRIAQDFRLMVEPDESLPPAQQEERRRVFWSFYIADKLISCGRERPSAILDEHCKLQLPCDELAFRAGQPQRTANLDQLTGEEQTTNVGALSTFALTTIMASTLGRCAQYTLGEQENQGPGGKYSPWNPKSKFSSIHSTLLQLESDFGFTESLTNKIRANFIDVDGSIDQHRAAPLVFAHALFHLCQCMLYHPFLLKQRLDRIRAKAPLSFVVQAFDACRTAAVSLSNLMHEVKCMDCETVTTSYDPFYGYCTMVAGTIHALFTHSRDTHVVETAQTAFALSMQSLQELSIFWKSSSLMLTRLEEFQKSSDHYANLIDPTNESVTLSESDINDLVECLDYSRMSTQPRRRPVGGQSGVGTSNGISGTSVEMPYMSNVPSPFFDDFLNLLPLGYGRPDSSVAMRMTGPAGFPIPASPNPATTLHDVDFDAAAQFGEYNNSNTTNPNHNNNSLSTTAPTTELSPSRTQRLSRAQPQHPQQQQQPRQNSLPESSHHGILPPQPPSTSGGTTSSLSPSSMYHQPPQVSHYNHNHNHNPNPGIAFPTRPFLPTPHSTLTHSSINGTNNRTHPTNPFPSTQTLDGVHSQQHDQASAATAGAGTAALSASATSHANNRRWSMSSSSAGLYKRPWYERDSPLNGPQQQQQQQHELDAVAGGTEIVAAGRSRGYS